MVVFAKTPATPVDGGGGVRDIFANEARDAASKQETLGKGPAGPARVQAEVSTGEGGLQEYNYIFILHGGSWDLNFSNLKLQIKNFI